MKPESFSLSDLKFSDVKKMDKIKVVYVNRKDRNKVILQTPLVRAHGKMWREENVTDSLNDKFELNLSFSGSESDPKIKAFLDKMLELDELIKKNVQTNKNVKYCPIVRVPTDEQGNALTYPPTMRVKLDRKKSEDGFTGKFTNNKSGGTEVLFFNENKEIIDINEKNFEEKIPRGSNVVCVIELVYVSISSTGISTKWKLVQCKVNKSTKIVDSYIMLDDEDDDVKQETKTDPEPNTEESRVDFADTDEMVYEADLDEAD